MRILFSVLAIGCLLSGQEVPGCIPAPAIEAILHPETPAPSQSGLGKLEQALEANPGDFHLAAEYLLRSAVKGNRNEMTCR